MKQDYGFGKKEHGLDLYIIPHQWKCLESLCINFKRIQVKEKEQHSAFGFCHRIEQHTEKNCSLILISEVPSLRKIPCSTSAWESRETRSDIAQSSPADRQFSYWAMGLRPSLVSASLSRSATRSASGDPGAWPASAFMWDFGGLFRKNLFCDDRASWDKRLNFLDWSIWHDLAMGRKHRDRNHVKNECMLVWDSLWQFKQFEESRWDASAVSKLPQTELWMLKLKHNR